MDSNENRYPLWIIMLFSGALVAQGTQTQAPADRDVSWKQILPNILEDQQHIWTFPLKPLRGQDLAPTAAILGGTAALVAADPSDTPYFQRTNSFHGFNSAFASKNTAIGTAVVPSLFYAVGLARHDTYAQHTALLAGEAVADCEILDTVLKSATRRLRPSTFATGSKMGDTWFESPGNIVGRGSFPSGHSIAAFSVATVFSRRYPKHRWVPSVAYGLAATVGLSRVTLSAHFPSDVFLGGALGYTISRFTVLGGH
jgi:membrane-associated phospholipid phosphatase